MQGLGGIARAVMAVLATGVLTCIPAGVATSLASSPTAYADEVTVTPVTPTTRRFFWANAWAAYHTAPGGDVPYALPGAARMRLMVGVIRRSHAQFGVLAEYQPVQRRAFRKAAGSRYRLVDGGGSLTNGVFYDPSVFAKVGMAHTTERYLDGSRIATAVVVLLDRATGALDAVMPVHHPTTIPGEDNGHWRQVDFRAEHRMVTTLKHRYGAIPLLVAGDFNTEHRAYVKVTAWHWRSPLPTRPTVVPIDQAFAHGARFQHYRVISGSTIDQATDHDHAYTADVRA